MSTTTVQQSHMIAASFSKKMRSLNREQHRGEMHARDPSYRGLWFVRDKQPKQPDEGTLSKGEKATER